MTIHSTRIRKLALGALALLVAQPALSAGSGGGGGGGSSPSDTAPQYDPAVEYQKGVAALQARRWADAEKAFKRVLAVTPRDANTNYLMGLAKIGSSDFKGAKPFLERAVRTAPGMVNAHGQLGVTYAKLGDAAKAQTELDWLTAQQATCAGICSDSATLANAVAAVQAALVAGKQARADLPDLAPFRAIGRSDGAYLTAVALINEQRYDEAIISLEAAARSFGPHPDLLTYLGFTNRKLKRYDQAEFYYREALAVAPGHRGATEYFGELMLERGDVAGARAMLARLDAQCSFGCAEAEELRRWIELRSAAS